MKVPFSPPDISDAEINEVCETLRSGWITTGPRTKEFERRIAERCRADRAVALSSATAAMELVLRMLGIGEGDEVITTAYTYTATCSVICHVGATPVIVDTAEGELLPRTRSHSGAYYKKDQGHNACGHRRKDVRLCRVVSRHRA